MTSSMTEALTPSQITNLRGLHARATQGKWEVQDGCSWRRIGTRGRDGDVLCPTNSRTDGHPDLVAGRGEDLNANLALIVAVINALPSLLGAAERVERLEGALRLVAEHDTVMGRLEPDAHDAVRSALLAETADGGAK